MVKQVFAVEVTVAEDGTPDFSVLNTDVPLDQMVECITAFALLIERLNPESPLAPERPVNTSVLMEAYQ